MFGTIFKLVLLIISQPTKAWEMLSTKEEKDDEFLSRFIYPLIGLITLAAFLGILLTHRDFDVTLALRTAIKTLVSSFGGFFIGAYLLNEFWQGLFHRPKDMHLCERFVGYSSSLMFVLSIVLMLLPEFFFLQIFVLYTFYVVWEGAPIYMKVEDKEQVKFVVIATIIILGMPKVVSLILTFLMPGLNF